MEHSGRTFLANGRICLPLPWKTRVPRTPPLGGVSYNSVLVLHTSTGSPMVSGSKLIMAGNGKLRNLHPLITKQEFEDRSMVTKIISLIYHQIKSKLAGRPGSPVNPAKMGHIFLARLVRRSRVFYLGRALFMVHWNVKLYHHGKPNVQRLIPPE